MPTRIKRAALFALYQTSLLLGVLLLPVALVARRIGIRLPFGALVERLGDAYGSAR
jgi:hypothetical protein